MSTIHDPTDGTGRVPPGLTEGFCELIANPAIPDEVRRTALANLDHWNAEIAAEAEAQGAGLLDQHAVLFGRGMAAEPSWYHPDCSHPNDTGHDAIRRFAWWLLAGEWLPRPDAPGATTATAAPSADGGGSVDPH